MRGKRKHGRRAKHLQRTKGSLSSVKGVSHLSRRAKRRLYCKLQLWIWRKRRERCRCAMFKATRRTCLFAAHTQADQSNLMSSIVCHACDIVCEAVASQEEIANGSVFSQTAEPLLGSRPQAESPRSKQPTKSKSGHLSSAPLKRELAADVSRVVGPLSETVHGDADLHSLRNAIQEFLDDFYKFYGSFFPLQRRDVLAHLKSRFNTDFSHRKKAVIHEVAQYLTQVEQKSLPSFQLVYKKHTLTLDDLSTLADQNWLNDQVINMYGELMMDAAGHKLHVLNSFFHRQLITKGYDGVRRWTRQVDLFSKSLLLVPIHLEVHWCLVVASNAEKKIFLYDSQGIALQKVARNILKYLETEAQERKQKAFQHGWTLSVNEKIPQQTNENDCGVFVLEYSRCLALAKPLLFSQKDIPKIRKRIYKELCNCKLEEA